MSTEYTIDVIEQINHVKQNSPANIKSMQKNYSIRVPVWIVPYPTVVMVCTMKNMANTYYDNSSQSLISCVIQPA